MSTSPPAGWYPDPYDANQLRYWDGAVWTDSVSPAAGGAGPSSQTAPVEPNPANPTSPAGPAGYDSSVTQQIDNDDRTASLPTVFPYSTTDPFDPPPGAQQPGYEQQPGYGQPGQGQPVGVGQHPPLGTSSGDYAGQQDPYGGYAGQGPYAGNVGQPGGYGAAGAAPAPGTGFGDIGGWLASIFGTLQARIGPVVVLLFVIPAVGSAIAGVIVQRILAGITIDLDPPDDLAFRVEGLSGGLAILLLLVGLVGALAAFAGRLGANHQLYAAHGGRSASLGASFGTALRRLPLAVVWGIALAVLITVVVTVFTVAFLVVVGASIGVDGDGSPLLALLVVPLAAIGFAVGVWLWVKLAFFLVVLAVGPPRTNPFAASAAMSRGRFWSVLGRLLLVAFALALLWLIFNGVFQPLFGAATATLFQLDPVTGDVFVDGQDIDTLDEIRFADFIPSVGWFALVAATYALGRSVIDAIWTSAITGLYWRGGGRGEV